MFALNDDITKDQLDEKVSRKILGYGGHLMLVEVSFKKGGVGAIHAHPHEQVSYIAKGSFEVTNGPEKKVLKQGDSFYVPGGVKHGTVALEDAIIVDSFTPLREDFLK